MLVKAATMDSYENPSKIRIFVSSPGDVAEERTLTARVIKRLQDEFSPQCEIEPIFWEHEPLVATENFQVQIVRPSQTDIVICILWSRLGSRLPSSFARADGTAFQSGTEFEFEDAVEGRKLRGIPDLLVYRKTAEPMASLQDEEALLRKLQQRKALSQFIERWFHDQDDGTLVAAFHPFSSSADYQEILEEHLRKLVQRRIPDGSGPRRPAPLRPPWTHGSPFRGLNVFEFGDAAIFFGRNRAVSTVLDNLRKQAAKDTPFLLITGMSGCGKSSLVRAGVLPLLTEPQVIEGVREWRRAIFRPTDSDGDLIRGLGSSLLQQGCLPELASSTEALPRLLRENPDSASTLIRAVLRLLNGTDGTASAGVSRLVLLIDPLEEIFTDARVTPDERRFFLQTLKALAKTDCVWIIATLRTDFYFRCEELPDLLSLGSGDGTFHLPPPTPSEISQLVRRPAEEVRVRFDVDAATGFQLDDALIDAATKDPNNLPLLEFTLDELYKQRTSDGLLTWTALNALGGVEGAIAARAEEIFETLSPRAQLAFSKVFASLVSVGSVEQAVAVRKPAILDSEFESPAARELINEFVAARLLTADRTDDGRPVIRVAHEALLVHWPKLKKWIEESRDFLRARARIENPALIWNDEGRSDDFLLSRGKPLTEARKLVKDRWEELLPLERLFISASIKRASRRRFRSLAIAVSILTAIAGLALWGIRDRSEQSKPAIAQKLAGEALQHRSEFDLSALLAIQAYRTADIYETRNALLSSLESNLFIVALHGKWGVKTISFSPDGKTLAAGGWHNDNQETLQFWDVATRAPIGGTVKGYTDTVDSLAWSPDGKMLVSAGRPAGQFSNRVYLWDVASQRQVGASMTGYEGLPSASFSPDGGLIAVSGSWGPAVQLLDPKQRKVIGELERSYKDKVTSVAFSPDGKILASTYIGMDSYVRLWDPGTRKFLGELQADSVYPPLLQCIAFSPDGETLAAAGGMSHGDVLLWNVQTRLRLGDRIDASRTEITSIAFSPDGSTLATASLDGNVRLWNPVSHDLVATLAEPQQKRVAPSVAYSPDGKILASSNEDGTINLWDVSSYARLSDGKSFDFYAHTLKFSPDGKILAAVGFGSEHSQMRLWDVGSHEPLGEPIAEVSKITFSPNDKILASANHDDSLSLWSFADHKLVGQLLEGHTDSANGIAFSPDGQTLVSIGTENGLRQWDVASKNPIGRPVSVKVFGRIPLAFSLDGSTLVAGEKLWGMKDHQITQELWGPLFAVAFSPNGTTLAASDFNNSVSLWDIAKRAVIGQPFEGESGQVGAIYALAFSPDGKTLATGGQDRVIRFWDLLRRVQMGDPLTGHHHRVERIAFTHDAKILVSLGADDSLRFWDVASHKPLGAPTPNVRTFELNPRDTTIAITGEGAKVTIWNLSPRSWIDKLCGMVQRDLTLEEWREYMGSGHYEPTCPNPPLQTGPSTRTDQPSRN
jgi:WD40 repeat protein